MLHKFVYYHCSGTMLVFSSFFILILLYVLPKQRPNFFFKRLSGIKYPMVQGGSRDIWKGYSPRRANESPLKNNNSRYFSHRVIRLQKHYLFHNRWFFLSLRIVWWNNRVEENVDVLNGISCVNRFSYYIWGISPLLTKLILINWFLET